MFAPPPSNPAYKYLLHAAVALACLDYWQTSGEVSQLINQLIYLPAQVMYVKSEKISQHNENAPSVTKRHLRLL